FVSKVAGMKTWTALLACILVVVGVAVFLRLQSTVASETLTIYGLSTGRREERVQYFDKAAAAFDAHLKSLGFAVTTKPASIGKEDESDVTFRMRERILKVGEHF